METGAAGVYAIGDVTGKLPLAHAASAQGVLAAEHIAGLDPQPLDYAMMPRATYCQPQVGSFGLTEAQARERGHGVNVGTFNVQANGKALAMGESEGIVKLVTDESDRGAIGRPHDRPGGYRAAGRAGHDQAFGRDDVGAGMGGAPPPVAFRDAERGGPVRPGARAAHVGPGPWILRNPIGEHPVL